MTSLTRRLAFEYTERTYMGIFYCLEEKFKQITQPTLFVNIQIFPKITNIVNRMFKRPLHKKIIYVDIRK